MVNTELSTGADSRTRSSVHRRGLGGHNLLVWDDDGLWDSHRGKAASSDVDELTVYRARVAEPPMIENDGHQDLVIPRSLGLDLNPDTSTTLQHLAI